MARNIGRPAKLPPGPNALWDWMDRMGFDQRQTAQLLGIHFVSLNQILHGDRRPGLAIAMRIERHTGINPGIWLRTPVRESRSAVAVASRKRNIS